MHACKTIDNTRTCIYAHASATASKRGRSRANVYSKSPPRATATTQHSPNTACLYPRGEGIMLLWEISFRKCIVAREKYGADIGRNEQRSFFNHSAMCASDARVWMNIHDSSAIDKCHREMTSGGWSVPIKTSEYNARAV